MLTSMTRGSACFSSSGEDGTATLEKDLFLNLLAAILLLVSAPALLAAGRAAAKSDGPKPDTIIYVDRNGQLHLDSTDSPHVTLEDVTFRVRDQVGEGRTEVGIAHGPEIPGRFIHEVLTAVDDVNAATAYLGLVDRGADDCLMPKASYEGGDR